MGGVELVEVDIKVSVFHRYCKPEDKHQNQYADTRHQTWNLLGRPALFPYEEQSKRTSVSHKEADIGDRTSSDTSYHQVAYWIGDHLR